MGLKEDQRSKKNVERALEEEIEYTVSSGNVYKDAGYPNPQEALAKARLAMLISDAIEKKNLTQQQAADLLGIDQPKISLIVRGKLSGFTIDRLFRYLQALNIDIFIETKPHKERKTGPFIWVSVHRNIHSPTAR